MRLMVPDGLTRRQWLQVSGLAGVGLSVPSGWALGKPASVAGGSGFGKAKSVLLVFASGGQSQLEMWDPKPDAPEEIRGEFGSIPTSVPALRFGEHMPMLARLAHRYTVVRSVSHEDLDHGSAVYLALTGHYHAKRSANPPPAPTDQPTYGAIVQQLHRERRLRLQHRLPFAAVHVNAPAAIPELLAPGQFPGLLGRACEPLTVGDPTEEAGPIGGLEPVVELAVARQQERRALLDQLDSHARLLERNAKLLEMSEQYRQAYDLLSARQIRHAFDIEQEPERVRERYGQHRSGQSCLLARRLVEAGVPWITLVWNHCNRGQDKMPDNSEAFGWDTHNDIFAVLRNHLLPRFDQSFSALLEDLEQRGLLETTLVVCMGEFGRAPLVAKEVRMAGEYPGRAHWAAVYSIVMAGAGVKPGAIYGGSDRKAAYPSANPVGPWDVSATMFHALGVDPESHYHDSTGRPYPICGGKPIIGLF